MDTSLDFAFGDAIYFNIVVVGIFLAFFFVLNGEYAVNRWMSGIFLVFGLHFANLLLLQYVEFSHFGFVFGLLYGPLVLQFILGHSSNHEKRMLFHFLPSGLLLVRIMIQNWMKIDTSTGEIRFLTFFVFAHLLCYLVYSYFKTAKLHRIWLQTRAITQTKRINLIQMLLAAISLLYLLAIVNLILDNLPESIGRAIALSIASLILLCMLGLIYMGLGHPYIFRPITDEEELIVSAMGKKYKGSVYTIQDCETCSEILVSLMEKEKSYRQPDISLGQLAKESGFSPRLVSQAINECLEQSFFDFVNGYRIKDAKNQLKDKDRRVSEIMYDVGFSSRSSFNVAFKKHAGTTPTQFRAAN
ncbi:helix-turn-helix domain-containing protein [Flagellimonas meishanensis]|uniref:helix-turn-helix domain-containing protein n=1 Tax=Flagellimonas meishanensis TaxID=2873264 RepID=UPI001CA64325|nr:AraC family transcriptional regulator [[Muricauda] meishanensis]